MKVKKAMQKQGLKYFSSLSAKQKDRTINNILIIKHGLTGIPYKMALTILNNMQEIKRPELKGTKVFSHKGDYYPLNIKDLLAE